MEIEQLKALISNEELKAMRVKRHTLEVEEKLNKSTVAIAGLGGLGSNIAFALTRAGVGNLILVDFDKVDISNLNRQDYRIEHLGINKTEALRNQLYEVNPYINIKTHTVKVTRENSYEIFKDANLICEAFDKADQKAILVDEILTKLPDKYLVSGSGMAGYKSSNSIKTRKITNKFYLSGDGVSGIEDGLSLFASRVLVCAAHEANMAIRLLLGEHEV